jgi:hypothetical protein
MNFSTPQKCLSVINATDIVERERSENRDKIARGINGFPPLSYEKAKQMGLKVNISWLEETVLAKQATLQYFNAFQSRNNFFTIDCPSMPQEKRADWCLQMTQFINKPLKESREFSCLFDNENSSVVAHGIAPKIWLSTDNWLSEFVAINDLRVATDTLTSLANLCWFGVRRRYTIGELVNRVFGKYSDKGWDKKAICKIIAAYWDKNWETVTYDWSNNPEKMTQLIKQNIGFYMSDAVPIITLWHFYHINDENPLKKEWMMKVIPDKTCRGVSGADGMKFLLESDEPVAEKLDHLLHIQFGDLNGTPPYMYHSVRSLGFLLHESCFWMNLFRCRTFQHAWESFNLLWRSADGSPKARAQFLELFHKGYVPNDISIVPMEKKNRIDQALVEFVMAQAKQLMGEASASYTQEVDTGTKREQTLGEAQIKLQQSNAMMTGMLAVAARNKVFEYREICRRFCIKKTLNPDARKFQQQCKEAGIPKQFLDVSLWDIACDMPLGSGNQVLELAEASQLMQSRGAYGPDAQQDILHIYTAAVTKNPKLAQRLAPTGVDKAVSNGQSWASAIFGTLMQGTPVPMRSDINPIDQIKTLLGLTAGVVQKIMQGDNMGTPDDIAGMSVVVNYITNLIQSLEQDPANNQLVKQFSDSLGKLTNIVKGFAQRQAEKGKQGMGNDLKEFINIAFKDLNADTKNAVLQMLGLPPSQMPEIDPKVLKAGQGMQIKQAQFDQKQKQTEIAFQLEQLRKLTEHQVNLSTEQQTHNQELAHATIAKLHELMLAEQQPEQPKSKSE